ncbi:MAG: flagellar basal body L-ring protein FlgH [Campylobacterota bacterium]|nr:flagellar basal body L-ring protein FlgH [Campylobacterota bacterium]
MRHLSNILLFVLFFVFTGCEAEKNDITFEKPRTQVVKPIVQPTTNKGSLYSKKGGSLFSDKKDLQIGDILQVVIVEELKSDSKNSRALNRANSTSLGAGVVGSVDATNPSPNSTINSMAKKINRAVGFEVSGASTNTFTGGATSKYDESFETTVSVIIEQVYQNGNYYIKGFKEILIDGQKQYMMIAGVIRPYDISPENTVNSAQVANLKILYRKDGSEADNLEKPWGSKVLESIWPF